MTEVRIETCPKHGLRYNAAVASGCARCVRENAGNTPVTKPKSASLSTPLGPQAFIAGALIIGCGSLFFAIHNEIAQSFRGSWGGASSEAFEESSEETVNAEIEGLLLFAQSPVVQMSRRQDPEIDELLSELEDEEIRAEFSEEELREKIDLLYEKLTGESYTFDE